MKSVVTGGLGFIGSHIVDRLIQLGHDVYVVDDMRSTLIKTYEFRQEAKYFAFDVCDRKLLSGVFRDADYVFHLAAESRIPPCIENPILAVESNVLGTATVLECAREAGVKRVIYSSTSSVYGNNIIDGMPQHEWFQPDPLNPYSVTKLAGEHLCKMYYDLFGLETVTLRYFNVYGPREPLTGTYAPVVGVFINNQKKGEPLVVTGPGTQSRDFVHVKDVVEANILSMNLDFDKTKYRAKPINIGTGKPYSIMELAMMVADGNDIVLVSGRPGEANRTQASTDVARWILGWEAKEKIEDYVKQSLA